LKRIQDEHRQDHVAKLASGPELNALVAERVMGWKNVQRQDGRYWGRKQDKAGRWRRAAVRNYCENPADAYLVDERIEQLGLLGKYLKELAKITREKKLPVEWASPEQRCRAALKIVRK
jgi:Phage ABA sandwich domain